MMQNSIDSLTDREMEVLHLLADGFSNKQIASKLFIEETTVKWYNAQIYGKLAVKNRKQAVVRGRTLGILEIDSSDPLQRINHNLPADTIPFVGRAGDIHSLLLMLEDDNVRLVTILGPGGMGKTRLSIEAGRRLLVQFKDGVYFVPFVTVTTHDDMLTTLAAAVGCNLVEDIAPESQLINYLRPRQLLLICDNLEHLLEDVSLLTTLLEAAPDIKILTTSREKLRLSGEVVYNITGLTMANGTYDEIEDADSVKLFIDAASRIPHHLSHDDMPLVARICVMLGGMPLGILLAAAWLDTLSLAEIESELQSGFEILASDLRDAPPRHRSVEQVFEQSWNRLSVSEQTAFMQLSVFQGGFTRDAAKVIAGASLRDLQRLVHGSFIQLQPNGRYTIHELMRQFGERKLLTSTQHEATQARHAQYFANVIQALGNIPIGFAGRELLEAVHANFENIRAAWQFEAQRMNIEHMCVFLDGLLHYCDTFGRPRELLDLFEPILMRLTADNEQSLFRAQVIARIAWILAYLGDHDKSLTLTHEALSIVTDHESLEDMAMLNCHLSHLYTLKNDYDAAYETQKRTFDLLRRVGRSKWEAILRVERAGTLRYRGQLVEALEMARSVPDGRPRYVIEGHLLYDLKEFESALNCYNRANEYLNFNLLDRASVYSGIFGIAVKTGQIDLAWRYLADALQFIDDDADLWGFMVVLNNAVELLYKEDQPETGVSVMSFIVHHPATSKILQSWSLEHRNYLEPALSLDAYQAAWERGKRWNLTDVITQLIER